MIQRTDRLSELLRQDASLLETLIALSPVFAGLRNPLMRRTMGRLATVEQAARVAGIDPDLLVQTLNRAVGGDAAAPDAAGELDAVGSGAEAMAAAGQPPAGLVAIPVELLVDLDVRDDLRNGREPFSRIMAARRELPAGGVLRLRAIFEPVPLYAVMARQGFDHWTEALAEDDWRVWFHPAAVSEAGNGEGTAGHPAVAEASGEAGGERADVVVIDVRGMEPPEPMVRTLAALEQLPEGSTLLQINERVPQFLLPRLAELGFVHEVREQEQGVVRVFIRRRMEE